MQDPTLTPMQGPTEGPSDDPVLGILEGTIPPPTETIAFIAKNARSLRDQGNTLVEKERELQAQLAAVQRRLLQIGGAIAQYKSDVHTLLVDKPQAP